MSYLIVEPFAVLFWGLGIVLVNTRPCPPARHHIHHRTQGMSLYGHAACTVVESCFNSQRRRVGLPLFLSVYVIYLWPHSTPLKLSTPPKSAYTVPKAILWKEMFICTVRNVYQVLKKCFFTANHLAEKENFVLYIRNVCHTVFLSLQRNFSLLSSPLSFRAKSLLLSLFW